MSYAQATGRSERTAAPARAAVRPLSDAEQARVAERVALVKEHLPEVMPFIRELHDLGMVEGLRCIGEVSVFGKDEAVDSVDERAGDGAL